MNKRILILGGSGFIGVNLIDYFLNCGHEVIVYGRKYPLAEFNNRITFLKAGFTDISLHKEYLKNLNIGTAIYLINNFPVNSNAPDFEMCLELNKILINEVFDIVERFIFFSSGGRVYKSSHKPHHEDECLRAVCDYGKSKIYLEQFVISCAYLKCKKFLIVRPSNPYGPHQMLTGNQGLIAILLGRIMNGEMIQIWGSGNEIRDYIYIQDFVQIFYELFCVENPQFNIYNIGSGIGVSTKTILSTVSQRLPDYIIQTEYIENKKTIQSNILCNKRIIGEIGNYNFTDVNSGIEQFIEWLHNVDNRKL
ncbi:NAD-dependent epimerase/dehydratase family protein [Escherichia coli]|uniref:NAD-dependent epimerase/dehydratase family protein n=2 Tax=Escherichia coli TaxID=562 RepID=UPI0003912410|nr:NAD-dependent epimerase/dehydratase family protein [Escherichia coli]AUK11073.1 dTDP-glucose 4,6-dehydratase [Escherichia coli]EFB3730641.1 NAD-dependent epimerase/dehydratase family protein [Escherichia coli]EFG6858585.1 NAD-dependent epimerase/dehydratase family protein [Escherichia coli]EFJ5473141.1 NAD-dependent epimerase/dehydratase family protein [Escherichia coli]EGE2274203.1 dTDP-glucose 4,6-dehydratase [Escherichia coli]